MASRGSSAIAKSIVFTSDGDQNELTAAKSDDVIVDEVADAAGTISSVTSLLLHALLRYVTRHYYFASGRGAKYCNQLVCLSVRLLAYIFKTTQLKLIQF